MSERVVVWQNKEFETEFTELDPESGALHPVTQLHALTPYGMLLASLGTCTAILLHSYAQHHSIDLSTVELDAAYSRNFEDDCEHCEEIGEYKEQITMEVRLSGDLDEETRQKLFQVSKQCPIHKILEQGITVRLHLQAPLGTGQELAWKKTH